MTKTSASVGKRIGGALYIHRDAVREISASDQRLLRRALEISGGCEWNVARIEPERVALLNYESFDIHFPALKHSLLVDIQKRESKQRDFSSSTNPPILHRKELLLASSDRRRVLFAALTAELEARGLFADSHKIGLRRAWQERLDASGVVIRDHRIIQESLVSTAHPRFGPAVSVERHRTAIARNRLSSPMQMLARHGFLHSAAEVFDYGCGQGDDVRVLGEAGICARGWDPHFQPDQPKRPADIVNLGFVINVIEDPHERVQALHEAWSLCRKVMAIAVMAEGHYPVNGFRPFGDGFLTSRGTFQRFYSQHDLRALVREALDVEPVPVAPGIVFVFREAEAEQEFLFRRRIRRLEESVRFAPSPRIRVDQVSEPISERLKPVLQQLWAMAIKFGREPEADEVQDIKLELSHSNVSMSRAMSWCREIFDETQLAEGARRRRDDLIVHFALGTFRDSRAFATLPLALRRDVRRFFGSFGAVQSEARRFLFSLGSDSVLEEACTSAVANVLVQSYKAGRFYFQAGQLEGMPAALRTFVGCAAVLVGDAEDASVIAVNAPKRSVKFYFSPDFGARLQLFDRVATVSLRDQHVRDQKLSNPDRLLFMQGSSFESDAAKRQQRSDLEARVRSILPGLTPSIFTVRYVDVAFGLARSQSTRNG
jgi:DNA phosphorothioation-associated putative methyltransferase